MSTASNKQTARLDQFFTGAEARHDRWRSLLSAARGWDAAVSQGRQDVDKQRSTLADRFGELRQWEDFFANHLAATGIDTDSSELALSLAQGLKLIRPELDIYLLSDREVEKVAGDPEAECVRRIFYQVEEPLELHLSVLEGVAERFNTP